MCPNGTITVSVSSVSKLVRRIGMGRMQAQRSTARGVAYNTARSRLDDVVTAIDGEAQPVSDSRVRILERLAAGEISTQDAHEQLRRL